MVTDLHGAVYKLLYRYDVCSLFQCFPYIHDAGYDEELKDIGDGKTLLSWRAFEWLVSVQPSHLVYRSGDTCYLQSYVPSQFAPICRYDQLYVGNPNTNLAFMGSLIMVLALGGTLLLVVPRHDCVCH